MDLLLIVVGVVLLFLGRRQVDGSGARTGAGGAMLAIGAVVLLVGGIIFSVTFAGGFAQGIQSS